MRLARSIIALFVCAVSSLVEAQSMKPQAADRKAAGIVLAVTSSIEHHSRFEKLSDVCRAGFAVNGCTDFPVERLECNCIERSGGWVIEGRAAIKAVIHVSTEYPIQSVMVHERAHIADLEAGLRAHLDAIGKRTFGSRKACETYARVLTDTPHLRIVMNELRRASNVKFGCDRKGRF